MLVNALGRDASQHLFVGFSQTLGSFQGELFLQEKDRNKNLILSAGEAGGAHP